MNATLAPTNQTLVSTSDRRVLSLLQDAGFTLQENGWFYPAGPIERAAVRIDVFGGQYRIQRRRKLNAAWMVIATADTGEFDPDSFRVWQNSWPLNF